MDFSTYTVSVPTSNGVALFNTFTGQVVVISDNTFQQLQSHTYKNIKAINILQSSGFLCRNRDEEQKIVKDHIMKKRSSHQVLAVTILTTWDCDFNCAYCHEHGYKKKLSMERQTQIRLVNWIKDLLIADNYKKLILYFYGGEPTLNFDALTFICDSINAFCFDNHIETYYTMSTHGYSLNDYMVKELKRIGLRSVQITLDGPPKVHNYRRPRKNGEETFEKIINNIINYKDDLSILIRANVDKENLNSIPALMDILLDKKVLDKVRFYVDLVSSIHNPTEHTNAFTLNGPEEQAAIISLWREQARRKIPFGSNNVVEGGCGDITGSNFSVMPDGKITICPGLCGIDEMVVGDIFSGYNELYQTLISKNVWERCVSCRYFPVCLGGCKAQAYMKYNTCLRCYCRKSYYDKVVPEYIKTKFFFERDD